MPTEKTVKYDETLSANMKAAYTACKTQEERDAVVEAFAVSTGYGVRSIRGKMSREKYYIAKVATNKNGEPAKRKEVIVQELADMLNLSAESVESLTNATKGSLLAVVDAVQAILPETDAE